MRVCMYACTMYLFIYLITSTCLFQQGAGNDLHVRFNFIPNHLCLQLISHSKRISLGCIIFLDNRIQAWSGDKMSPTCNLQ